VFDGKVSALVSPHALAYENTLLVEEENDKAARRKIGMGNPTPKAIFWATGAHDPATYDAAKAEAVARWGAQRRRTIAEWARASENAEVKAAAEKLFPVRRLSDATATPTPSTPAPRPAAQVASTDGQRPLQPKIAAERVLLYRRVLAAWAFLHEMKEQDALDCVRELTDLERTPLPKGRG
jgi:hypothetical protein